MFCQLPMEPLLHSLLAPAPLSPTLAKRRIAATLPSHQLAFLEAAASTHFCSRLNATTRALLSHAMASNITPAPAPAPAADGAPVMAVLQIGALQHDWLAALGGVDPALAAVLERYVRMANAGIERAVRLK